MLTSMSSEIQPQKTLEIPEFLRNAQVAVEGEALIASKEHIFQILKKAREQGYWLNDLCGVEQDAHFEVVYQLWNYDQKKSLTIKLRAQKWDAVPSAVPIWMYANWHEREAFDMFGIIFQGHPNLKRLLLPEDWNDIPPLRKEFKSQNLRDAHRVITDITPEEWAKKQIGDERLGQGGRKVGTRLE